MKAEFSEFSYGFALAFEIINAFYPEVIGVPFFPSLQQEASLGYDANFTDAGWPLFLQFKLSDYMTRNTATYWGFYGQPFYRVSIHRRRDSDQHNLLKCLAGREPEVYYVAPSFRKQRDFNRLFVNGQIFTSTVFIPLNILPILQDDNSHYITYEASSMPSRIQWHSDEEEYIPYPISGGAWLEHLKSLVVQPRDLGTQYFFELRSFLVQTVKVHVAQPELLNDELSQVTDLLSVMRDITNLLATYFGVVLIFLRPLPR